jgi:hypothetical protein
MAITLSKLFGILFETPSMVYDWTGVYDEYVTADKRNGKIRGYRIRKTEGC